MDLLIPKLLVTSVLVALASVVQRRWGHATGGAVASLPLTSGPLLLYLAFDHGPDFATNAAGGSFVALNSFTAYAFGYAYTARRRGWKTTLAVAMCCFLTVAAGLVRFAPATAVTAGLVVPAVVVALRFWPKEGAFRQESTVDIRRSECSDGASRWWEVPMRVLVAVVVTAGLTEGAPVLGAELTGLLGMVPVFSCVLATSTHHRAGPAAVARFLRNVVVGQPSCLGFFVVLIATLRPWGTGAAFALALGVTLVLQFGTRMFLASSGNSFRVPMMPRRAPSGPPRHHP